MTGNVEYFQPEQLPPPLGAYSHVCVAHSGKLVFVAGQVGVHRDGSLAGPGIEEQAAQTFRNVQVALESQGLPMSAVTKLTTYMTSSDDIAAFYGVREELFPELFPEGNYPPNTLLVIDRLVRPEFVVEIEAIAAAPE